MYTQILILNITENFILESNLLGLSILIFIFGLLGIIYRYENFLITMFSIEIMYFGITLGFLIISTTNVDIMGQIYSLMILILAAAESAVGLGLLIVLYRFGFTIRHTDYQTLRG